MDVANTVLPWRPVYLRRTVIAAFLAVFALILAAIEGLAAASERNDGIAGADPAQHYLWTYGPTAVLVLVSVAWSRVEFQSKLVAPWIRLASDPTDARLTVLLDYVSNFQIFALSGSLRNGDYTVSVTTAVSMIIKIMVIISTGLIALSWTPVGLSDSPLVLQDVFVDDGSRLNNTGSLPYYVMQGVASQNLSYPVGLTEKYAFQSVRTNLSIVAEVQATVDGFTGSLDCRRIQLNLTSASVPSNRMGWLNVNITSPECNVASEQLDSPAAIPYGKDYSVPFTRLKEVTCDGTSGEAGKRVLVLYGNLTYYYDETSKFGIPSDTRMESNHMLCAPTYSIHRVDVVQNGTQTLTVAQSPGSANRTLSSVTPWGIMAAHFLTYGASNPIEESQDHSGMSRFMDISGTRLEVDPYMANVLLGRLPPGTKVESLADFDFLQKLAVGYYEQFSAILAKQTLMEPASIETTGFAIMNQNRLVVRPWAAQWMAGLAASCIILTLITLFLVPRHGILPCNPSSILGAASILLHSHQLLDLLRNSGAADDKHLEGAVMPFRFQSGLMHDDSSVQYAIVGRDDDKATDGVVTSSQASLKPRRPALLRPASRLILCSVLIALVVTLEVTLHKSDQEDGLGDVLGDDTYLHYTWTAIPSLVMGILALVLSSIDSSIMALKPYTTITQPVETKVVSLLSLLDTSVPHRIYKEIKLADVGAVATTSALLVASLFTIFSGSLFQPLPTPVTSSVTLRVDQAFNMNPGPSRGAGLLSSLIFESNLSYPRFTYSNLAFPELSIVTLPADNERFNLSSASITAVVPALRISTKCTHYDASEINTNLTLAKSATTNSSLDVLIKKESCPTFDGGAARNPTYTISLTANTSYFALGKEHMGMNNPRGCSHLLYLWGQFDYTAQAPLQHIAALGCNVTFEAVDVDTAFVGNELDLDPRVAPIPREDTVRVSPLEKGDALAAIYEWLADLRTASPDLNPFFVMLTSSPWAIPVSSLGNASASEEIGEAIKFHHGIIQAQNLAQQRVIANDSTALQENPRQSTDEQKRSLYSATVIDPTSRLRVKQDAASTHVLAALLGAALVLTVLSWILMPPTSNIPARSPNTIASMVTLVAGGNLRELLAPRMEKYGYREVSAALGDRTRYWMGWGMVPDQEGMSKGGENLNRLSRYGIFAIPEEEAEPLQDIVDPGMHHFEADNFVQIPPQMHSHHGVEYASVNT
ncbi:hypothetical protein GQ53DRAFT_846924 [Thozetella sp. PMI_491]|nr:hypothetical protein GQ53DRAFT_846924 [Thozetella sp. PMI_491]